MPRTSWGDGCSRDGVDRAETCDVEASRSVVLRGWDQAAADARGGFALWGDAN